MPLLTGYLTRERMKRIAPYVHGDVLDLGCGGADVYRNFGSRINHYCGVEYSDAAVDALRAKHPEASFLARNLDRDALGLDRQYDCILMVALIEHLFNQQHVMSNVAMALKPGGRIVVTTPTPFGNDIVHRMGAKLGLFSKAAVDDHIVIYNHHRFGLLAGEIGLKLAHYQRFQLGCNQLVVLSRG